MSAKKLFIWSGLFVFCLIALVTGAGFYCYQYVYIQKLNAPAVSQSNDIEFIVNPGDSFSEVSKNLEQAQLITDYRILKVFGYLNPDSINVKAGKYLLNASATPLEIVKKLVQGKVIQYSVTFPEGLTVKETADTWERSGFGTAEKFMHALSSYTDGDLVKPETGWEGYLFPETYIFTDGFHEEDMIKAMFQQLKTVLKPEWLAAAAENELDLHQVITLASLIEKETGITSERDTISGVFHNRLRKGMLLQCDPTVIYALGDSYTGRLLKKHLKVDSPFNTYMYPGLPPGPIASPGKESLSAACFPADVKYLYFVADNNGGHRFSRTLREHNRAVEDYRRGLKRHRSSKP